MGIPWRVKSRLVFDAPVAAAPPLNADFIRGAAYFEGRGVPKDDVQALAYYRKAADAGDAKGQYSVAYMYSNGLGGVPQDWVQANAWLRKAADQGDASAQDDLGVSYGDGRGIPQDWVQAYKWIDLAAKQGNSQAIKDLAYAKLHMTDAQIAQAKALSDARKKSSAARLNDGQFTQ